MRTVNPPGRADASTPLPGQDTLVASWRALAQLSPGAHVHQTGSAVAAVFPRWAPLNNAIVLPPPTADEVARAVTDVAPIYESAGVHEWALWLPSVATGLDVPETFDQLPGLRRDTTTLVMTAALHPGLRQHEQAARTSIASATAAAGERPVPVDQLEPPDDVPGLAAWVMVVGDVAVAGAWSFLRGSDCGIYTVGTLPQWRRRGLARDLTEHALADASRHGAVTASVQSTAMAEPLYASLGFRPAGRYEEWTTA